MCFTLIKSVRLIPHKHVTVVCRLVCPQLDLIMYFFLSDPESAENVPETRDGGGIGEHK